MFIFYNPNPSGALVGDCTIRAITKLEDISWDKAYAGVTTKGFELHDMPSANAVWGAYLKSKGFQRYIIPNTCPDCYTVAQFAEEHPFGKYLLATGSHVVTVEDGNYFDAWDSGMEIPIYFWTKEEM